MKYNVLKAASNLRNIFSLKEIFFKNYYRSSVSVGAGSRLTYRNIRIISGGKIFIGNGSVVGARISILKPGATVNIGSNTFIGISAINSSSDLFIGDNVLISHGCMISDTDGHSIDSYSRSYDLKNRLASNPKNWEGIKIRPIKISNDSWIGYGAIILKGVSIGEDAIVGAGSVVTGNVAPGTIVAGNPARVVRSRQA